MKGGLYIEDKYNIDGAFDFFLENSNITYLSRGSFGIVFKCELNNYVVKSPYDNLRNNLKNQSVRTIIIKFSLIHFNGEKFIVENTIGSVDTKIFEDEVKKQVEIFDMTKDKLDPICPSIIYADYLNGTNFDKMKGLLGTLYEKIVNAPVIDKGLKPITKLFEYYQQDFKNESDKYNYSFGLIGMEMMDDGYDTLDSLPDDYKSLYEDMARLRLIELAIKTRYSHNDYHQSNILVNTDAIGYYGKDDDGDDINGHVILIDFGYTKKIPDDLMAEINDKYNNGDYFAILEHFYIDPRLNNVYPGTNEEWTFLRSRTRIYEWILNIHDKNKNFMDKYNDYLDFLYLIKDNEKKLSDYDEKPLSDDKKKKRDKLIEYKNELVIGKNKVDEEMKGVIESFNETYFPSNPVNTSATKKG